MSDASDDAVVGSFGEEALKLFGVLSGWAVEHAGQATDGLSDLAAHAAASAQLNENLSTGSAECNVWCPVCRVMHAARQLSPEVTEHLAAAAASLAQAAAALTTPPKSSNDV